MSNKELETLRDLEEKYEKKKLMTPSMKKELDSITRRHKFMSISTFGDTKIEVKTKSEREQLYAKINYEKARGDRIWRQIELIERDMYKGVKSWNSYAVKKTQLLYERWGIRNKLQFLSIEELKEVLKNQKAWNDSNATKKKRNNYIASKQVEIIADSINRGYITKEEAIERLTIVSRNLIASNIDFDTRDEIISGALWNTQLELSESEYLKILKGR